MKHANTAMAALFEIWFRAMFLLLALAIGIIALLELSGRDFPRTDEQQAYVTALGALGVFQVQAALFFVMRKLGLLAPTPPRPEAEP